MKTDLEIKNDVLEELTWLPYVYENQIGVIVKDGVVTLNGLVFSYPIKLAVEKAVKNIVGVKAFAEELKVGYISSLNKNDTEIANSAINAIEWNASVPNNKVIVEVQNGWITLSGTLEHAFQRDAAKRTVGGLTGVKGVTNLIILEQAEKSNDIEEKIIKAFNRSSIIDAEGIKVETTNHAVKLSGKVHSLAQKEEAQKTAFNAPGVYEVQNELKVEY
ncbi:Osmotically-inducible protein OsmY, contains BON domain [Polaribacter sp. KT25b]|uniref:BON domain-containing protein n=1 Tax=Polaribacter sp. KT25b TaxID=1855336 RepID=UPI00087B1114|nr:BON domain-containing protein [Polaribacter sp. KT25b]SDS24304.1 Osmotically-inducible protein OsmY, contains BON domain [Polaribacter sp. KT25b]